MLHQCRKKAASEGLSPRLYQQPMHAFELPRNYRIIHICGSLGLAGGRDQDLDKLRRCYAHLEDNGALILNILADYTSPGSWNDWLPEARAALPQPWPDKGSGRVASDSSTHFAQFRLVAFDPLEQSYTRQVRLEKWFGGELVATLDDVDADVLQEIIARQYR
jgi:hypothetical protein